jgi:hypothetical protein
MSHGITREEFLARRAQVRAAEPFHPLDAYTDDEVRRVWGRILDDADAIDADAVGRGGLIIDDTPLVKGGQGRTPSDLVIPALVGGGLLLAALAVNWIVGGGV